MFILYNLLVIIVHFIHILKLNKKKHYNFEYENLINKKILLKHTLYNNSALYFTFFFLDAVSNIIKTIKPKIIFLH